jgi:hypothetical protein
VNAILESKQISILYFTVKRMVGGGFFYLVQFCFCHGEVALNRSLLCGKDQAVVSDGINLIFSHHISPWQPTLNAGLLPCKGLTEAKETLIRDRVCGDI